jgi:hypothetical protein
MRSDARSASRCCARPCPQAIAAVIGRHADADRILVDTTGVDAGTWQSLPRWQRLPVRAASARAARSSSRRRPAPAVIAATLGAFELVAPTCAVVTKADGAPWEPIASQIAGHGIAVRALSRSRSVADSLTPTTRAGLARRLLAA